MKAKAHSGSTEGRDLRAGTNLETRRVPSARGPSKLGSIVIPAYNEGSVIRRCLDELFVGLDPGEVEVAVVCNGCTDDTAAQARDAGYPITVLDLPEPGKVGALRAGERAVTAMPRLFLDADVEISGETVRRVLDAVDTDLPRAARPAVRYETSRSTWPVRRYYAARIALPGVMADLCAAGSYAFSGAARQRFDEFPDLIGDDLFAARMVAPHEIVVVDTEPVVVHAPRGTRPLLRILKRVYRGNQELARKRPDLARDTTSGTTRDLLRLIVRPRHTVEALVYAWFVVTARAMVRLERDAARWERDDSSRA
jgi:glycosyltransferase involved in cell wall biosynthesis